MELLKFLFLQLWFLISEKLNSCDHRAKKRWDKNKQMQIYLIGSLFQAVKLLDDTSILAYYLF